MTLLHSIFLKNAIIFVGILYLSFSPRLFFAADTPLKQQPTINTDLKSTGLSAGLSAGQKLANKLASYTASAVYELDKELLLTILKPLLLENKTIKALKITENFDNELFIQYYQDKDTMVFNKNIPMSLLMKDTYTTDISINNEKIGKITLYYTTPNIELIERASLTEQEIDWIAANTVNIGIEPWSPIMVVNNEKIQGVTGDILNLVIKKTGLKVKLIYNSWDYLISTFKKQDIDLLPNAYFNEERASYGHFSKPYFSVANQIYTQQNNHQISSLNDLKHKKLAIVRGYATIKSIKEKYPDINIIETDNIEQSVQFVIDGQANALFDTQITTEFFLQEQGILQLKGIPDFNIPVRKLHFFTQFNQQILSSIVQKALNAISKQEKQVIFSKWGASGNLLHLTEEEQAWLDKGIPLHYVYDPKWAPFEWRNEIGSHVGIISDILHLIQRNSGLKFIPVHAKSWKEAVSLAKDKRADMYSGVGNTKERREYMNFPNKHIFSTYYVFVSRQSEDYLSGFDDMANKKLAIVDGYTIHGLLKEHKPNYPLVLVENINIGFDKLLNNEIDVFLTNAPTAKYYLKLEKYESLKQAYKTEFKLDLNIGIRSDWPIEVVSIIDKSIDNISKKEIDQIYNKWTEIKVTRETDYTILIRVVGGVLFLVILFIIWNVKQAKLMNIVKVSLETQKELEEKSRLLLTSVGEGIFGVGNDGLVHFINPAALEMLQYDESDILGHKIHPIIHISLHTS